MMLNQPQTSEYEDAIRKIKQRIHQIKTKMNTSTPTGALNQMDALNSEYEKELDQRLDQLNSLESQWKKYQQEQKSNRRRIIEKRQVEFNLELDSDLQNTLKSTANPLSNPTEIYAKLLAFLESNSQQDMLFTPVDLLDLFWTVNLNVPFLNSEVLSTIQEIKKKI